MANLSKIKREKMLAFLKKLKEMHNDDESLIAINEIENHLNEKKFGLVWEEHEENVDVMLKNHIPVFAENNAREIIKDPLLPFNFLLEGDNLQSLYLLKKTHYNRVDVIYIDPPYNRGKNDFVYDDDFIDANDTFRHSKWISFMYKRLELARDLLTDKGLIFISIDDNEVATLKLIMDEIFGEDRFINMFVWQRNSSGKTEKDKFTINTEYVLLYARSDNYELNSVFKPLAEATRKMYSKNDNDGRGPYRLYPLQKPKDPGPETTYDYVDNNGKVWPCPPKGWRMKYEKLKALENDGRLCLDNDTLSEKAYWNERDNEGKRVDTLWNDLPENSVGSAELEKIIGQQDVFNNPKPVDLIRRCIEIGPKNAIVLDFFAGSGTTAQAVLESNLRDGGTRRFILCTNNEVTDKKQIKYFVEKGYIAEPPKKGSKEEPEWKEKWKVLKSTPEYKKEISTPEYQSLGICNSVTFPRVKTIITGIRDDGTTYSEGYVANLKYFKCDWMTRFPENEYLSNLLCAHISEMVELKTMATIDQIKNYVILNRAQLIEFISREDLSKCENVWLNERVLVRPDEMKVLRRFNLRYLPKEFFGQELKEVAE